MSKVTNVILTHDILEDSDFVEIFLSKGDGDRISFKKIPPDLCGGSKCLEADIYLAALNHTSKKEILKFLGLYEWKNPEFLQVFVKEQDDDLFLELRN